ncbi:MAG: T9SS type A sorting domain-containing protein, partial [Saprospiraceae bacterium]|nr:T9SS type A sorting domain-containing protein [Saprospiraceae bacterium]
IIVDPADPDIVLACGNGFPPFQSAIYRSIDGGSTWEIVFNGTARVQQIIADPADFNIQYATINGQGIVKSTDTGLTWAGTGLGLSASGRIELTISPSNPQRMYAAAQSALSGGSTAAFMSDDGGETWQVLGPEDTTTTIEWLGEQGWYNNSLAVHPFNPDIVYVGGVDMFRAEITTTVRDKPATVTGVSEEGTDVFMDWINAGLSFLRGGLGTGVEWFEEHDGFPMDFSIADYRTVEIRFGPGKKQMAHRFTVPPNSGNGGDGGAGVVPADHLYQNYVEVPFEVWDVDENRQLMVSFRDQERDGKWNLIERSESDPVPGREYIFVNSVTYDPDNPSADITTAGGHGYKTIYCMWPTLAEGATFDEAALPESKLTINYGTIEERVSNIEQITTNDEVHVDIHNIQTFSTQSGSFKMIVATDGGLYSSKEEANPGESDDDWSSAIFGYNTVQFYGVDKKPNTLNYIGGTQDNGTQITTVANPGPDAIYSRKIGGDGFEVVWSYFEPDLVMGGLQNNRLRRSTDGGLIWNDITDGLDDVGDELAPFFTRLTGHKLLPRTVLTLGKSGIWRTNDFGETWNLRPMTNKWISGDVITSAHRVEFSLADPQIIWAGGGMTSDRNLHVSVNGGISYRIATNVADTIGSISGLATHPFQDSTAYALFSFRNYGKIFRTKDLGVTWEDISGFDGGEESSTGFPDVEINTLLVLPHEPETIWVGSEIGIVESTDNGESWHLLDGDLPAVSIYELIAVDDQVVAATHGRGIWTTTLSGLQWPIDVVAGIEDELNQNSFSIYPNPADLNTSLQFEALNPGPMVLRLIDETGRVVLERNYNNANGKNEFALNTSKLANGVYIINLQQNRTKISRRLVVRH